MAKHRQHMDTAGTSTWYNFPEWVPTAQEVHGKDVTLSPGVVARRIGELLVGDTERRLGRWAVQAARSAWGRVRTVAQPLVEAYQDHRAVVKAERRGLAMVMGSLADDLGMRRVNPFMDADSAAMWRMLDAADRPGISPPTRVEDADGMYVSRASGVMPPGNIYMSPTVFSGGIEEDGDRAVGVACVPQRPVVALPPAVLPQS